MATTSAHLDEAQGRFEALSRLAVEIAELRDLQQVLDTALQHCLEFTGSQFGFIGLTDAAETALDVVAIDGFQASPSFYERFHLIPFRRNIFALAVIDNAPVRTVDAYIDPRRVGQPHGHPPVHSFLGVPLRLRGRPIGMIGVANRTGAYQDEHEHLLLAYAAQVAIAIRNAQLYEALTLANDELEHKVAERTSELAEAQAELARKADDLRLLLTQTVTAQERERGRIALDMHDGLNQLVIGAMLELKAARQHLDSRNIEAADTPLQRVRMLLGQVDSELKGIIHDLRPPSLDALGLPAAIVRYTERYTNFTGMPCTMTVHGSPYRLLPEAEIGIYRVVQESLQNAAAHAQARGTWVILRFADEELSVEIGDDGLGFDSARRAQSGDGHLGILGMHERAQSLGGELLIESGAGSGTTVRLRAPGIHVRASAGQGARSRAE